MKEKGQNDGESSPRNKKKKRCWIVFGASATSWNRAGRDLMTNGGNCWAGQETSAIQRSNNNTGNNELLQTSRHQALEKYRREIFRCFWGAIKTCWTTPRLINSQQSDMVCILASNYLQVNRLYQDNKSQSVRKKVKKEMRELVWEKIPGRSSRLIAVRALEKRHLAGLGVFIFQSGRA